MMRPVFFSLLLLCSSVGHAQSERQPGPALESDELQKIKAKYEQCVMEKGLQLLAMTNFRDAVEFAPQACRRDLLQAKRFLLDSAFKLEVIDELVSSIEEGVRINLINRLMEKMQKG